MALMGRRAPPIAPGCWRTELAALMDEAERAEIDLAERLPEAADPAYAAHWARTLEFLHIVTRAWPNWLADQGLMNPAARQVALLNAQAATWARDPPADRVLLPAPQAGSRQWRVYYEWSPSCPTGPWCCLAWIPTWRRRSVPI